MQPPILRIAASAAFALLGADIALAQNAPAAADVKDLSGIWQGTLQAPPRPLRNVFKITKTDGAYKATNYSIDTIKDTPVYPANVKSVTVDGATVKLDVLPLGVIFQGKLSPDGNSIVGTWTLGAASQPLTLARATAETAWAIPDPVVKLQPMPADAHPVFDVATIRPSNPDARGMRFLARGRRYTTTNTSLKAILTEVFGLHPDQIAGGPDWMSTEKWDIAGEPDLDGLPSPEQWKEMLKKLLADRFQLKYRIEKKELAVYTMDRGKAEPKLTPSDGNADGVPHINSHGMANLSAQNSTVKDFTDVLQQGILDRPVIDRTGITGRYDFTLKWTPDSTQGIPMGWPNRLPPANDAADAPPDIYRAVQEQLGLKLETTRAPADILIIDHVERPSAN